MRCPSCSKDMQEILSEGQPIDYCTACRGAFLDKGEPAAFTHFPERVLRAIDTELIEPTLSRFRCPRCGGKMTEGGLFDPGYRVDRCNDCGGVWFDARELSQLAKVEPVSRPAPPARPPSPPAPPRASRGRSVQVASSPGVTWRCPTCSRKVTAVDRWQCSCRNVWNPFWNASGDCPSCGRVWDETKCPGCGSWAPRAQWRAK